jgi:ankyrin repeat protein
MLSTVNVYTCLLQPKDVQDSTPLHLAATYDHFRIAKLLLEEGANPAVTTFDLRTPLHEACHEGNDSIVELLLSEGENKFGKDYAKKLMDAVDDDGDTPLHLSKWEAFDSVGAILLACCFALYQV